MTYEEESRTFYKKMLKRRFIYELLLYRQYFENEEETLMQIFKSCLDNWVLDDNEVEEIIINVKNEMKKEYKLEIVSDEPLKFRELYGIYTNPFDIS